jgi:hypothetical protein
MVNRMLLPSVDPMFLPHLHLTQRAIASSMPASSPLAQAQENVRLAAISAALQQKSQAQTEQHTNDTSNVKQDEK